MMKIIVVLAFVTLIGTIAAFAQGEPGYPIPAPPAMFYDASVTADASGVTMLSIYFEGDGRGYVCWFEGKTGDRHRLTLKVLVPLDRTGNETRLQLVSPLLGWSELKLSVPVANATARVSPGAKLGPSTTGNGTTEFSVQWRGGDVELAWREPAQQVAAAAPVLGAEGTVMAGIDRRSIETEATLTVHSHGAEFDRFHVRLPKGARWVPGSASGYTVTQVASDDSASAGRLLEVRLLEKGSGPIRVGLNTTRSHNPAKPDEQIDLAGFEVVEAARQWGYIDIAAAGDWQVLFDSSRGVQRVDPLAVPPTANDDAVRTANGAVTPATNGAVPPTAKNAVTLQGEDVVARFEYFAQPCSLLVRLAAKQTRIRVEPEYLLLVDADQILLEANLDYTVRGAKAYELEVTLPAGGKAGPGWELDNVYQRVGEELMALGDVKVGGAGRYAIPLLQPSTGEIKLRLRAHWPIPENTDSLVLPLPVPRADSPPRSAVLVMPADNVKLTPNDESTVGLSRQQVTLQMEIPQRQQAPLSYRGEPGVLPGQGAVFSADFAVLRQSISAEVSSRVTVEETSYLVEQDLIYTIAHEPTDRLIVELPHALVSSKQLEFEHDGKKLALTDFPGETDNAPTQRKQIRLPRPYIGLCKLRVRYRRPFDKPATDKWLDLSVALVMPGEAELTGNRLHVTSAAETTSPAETRVDDRWSAAETGPSPPDRPQEWQWTSSRRTDEVGLSVRWADQNALGCTIVDRAWIQTWLTQSDREDRVVFSFTSNRKQLKLVVPPGNVPAQTLGLLDGKPVEIESAADGTLIVPLATASLAAGGTASFGAGGTGGTRHKHLLELRIHFLQQRPPRGRISLELPRPGDDVWIRQLRWQLILPKNEHLISTPNGFTGEFVWGWGGYGFGRKPLMDEKDLEAWVGISPGELPAADGTNRYLFSNFGRSGDVGRCELRTSGKEWIVLIASGAALVAGLLLIYVPASRHPAALLVAAVALMCVGTLYPEPTLLIAQAALLGLALTLMAGLLERTVARRWQGIMPNGLSASVTETGSTQAPFG